LRLKFLNKNPKKQNTMKKFFAIMAIASVMVACNNSADSVKAGADSANKEANDAANTLKAAGDSLTSDIKAAGDSMKSDIKAAGDSMKSGVKAAADSIIKK
jgi:hypothetical protein